MRQRPAALFGMLCLGSLFPACGYHTAGHTVTIPESVRTIAVPAFSSRTQTFKIEQLLTAAVVRELVTRTPYHVVSKAGEAADATLSGTVLAASSTPLTYDSQTGRAASAIVVVTMSLALTDRQGKVLYQNPSYLFREQYQISSDLATFFEEDSPAFERLARQFAQSLVSDLLEGF